MVVQQCDPFLWLRPDLVDSDDSYRIFVAAWTRKLEGYFAARACRTPEDLVQEVLERLTKKLGRGELADIPASERAAFVFGVAHHVRHEWERRPEAREVSLLDHDEPSHLSPLEDLIEEERLRLVDDAVRINLSRLSQSDREILLRTYLNRDHRPRFADVAEEEGIKVEAMRMRAARAKRRFLDLMKPSIRQICNVRKSNKVSA